MGFAPVVADSVVIAAVIHAKRHKMSFVPLRFVEFALKTGGRGESRSRNRG